MTAPDSVDAEHVPDLGPAPRRVSVDVDTVRDLIADQLPQWASLPVSPVATPGWDNLTFHLGDDLLVRMPSAAEYERAVEKEHRWLPVLASQLPFPVPTALALGRPGRGYPFHWSVYDWLPGDPVAASAVEDPAGLAADVTTFIAALRDVDPSGGPPPGVHNWFRGATLRTFDDWVRRDLQEPELRTDLDADAAASAWDDALAARWDGLDVWFHGDLAAGNILVDHGRIAAVIDFGTCGVGDPACDLAVAWTLLDDPGRRHLRNRLSIDDATWSRGRGWALWKALHTWVGALEDGDEAVSTEARRVVTLVVADHSG